MAAIVAATPKRVLNFLHAALQMQRKGPAGRLPRVPEAHARVGPALALAFEAFFPRRGFLAGGRVDEADLAGRLLATRAPWGLARRGDRDGRDRRQGKTSDPAAIRPVHPRDSAWDMVSS